MRVAAAAIYCLGNMARNEEYARLRDGGFIRAAQLACKANLTIRILSKKSSFRKMRGDVSSLLRDGMKVEDWLADCHRVFPPGWRGEAHLLALYLDAELIELV